MGDFDCSKPADGTPLLTCCGGGDIPTTCVIRTHYSVWTAQNYAFYQGGCSQYLQLEVRFYSLTTPTWGGHWVDQIQRPPAYKKIRTVSEGHPFPSVTTPITTISRSETSWIFTATLFTGLQEVSGLIRVEVTLSDPLGRNEILNALRTLAASFNMSTLANPASPSLMVSYYTQDGIIVTEPLTNQFVGQLPGATCSGNSVAGIIIAEKASMDLTGLAGGAFNIFGGSQASAVLLQSRLEMPAAWCSYYVPVSGINECRPLRQANRLLPVVAQCGTPVKTYHTTGGIIPVIAEQDGATSPDYIVSAACPGYSWQAPFQPCVP